jgi:hypothetical protein
MDYIEKANYSGKRHAIDSLIRRGSEGEATTWCSSRLMKGRTGSCIIPMISCQRCVAALRKANEIE